MIGGRAGVRWWWSSTGNTSLLLVARKDREGLLVRPAYGLHQLKDEQPMVSTVTAKKPLGRSNRYAAHGSPWHTSIAWNHRSGKVQEET